MAYNKTNDDLLNSKRLLYSLLREYAEGRLSRQRVFYRARVEEVGTRVGDLESTPPSPIGAIKASVYTNALDATLSRDALNVYYPLIPETIPQVGEHVLVMFEDVDGFSSGFWVSKLPQYRNINLANPDSQEVQARQSDSSDAFEGTTPASGTPNQNTIERRYRAEQTSREQEQTIANFEGQSNSIWTNKKVLVVGDSQMEPSSINNRKLVSKLRDKNVASINVDGRRSWGTRAWKTGVFNGAQRVKFEDLLQRENPQILLIFLGGNDAPRGAAAREDIQYIWDKAKSMCEKSYWVAPPVGFDSSGNRMAQRDRVSELIKTTIGSKNFIDSRIPTSQNPAGSRDAMGVHLTAQAGAGVSESWINYVINEVEIRNANNR